jgi:N-methylhydantoinase A
VAVDVGGTFTDFVLVRPGGSLAHEKVPTTPGEEWRGILAGLESLASSEHTDAAGLARDTEVLVHATTTADNIMITQSGATTGLITTMGHRDELELRRGWRESIWDPFYPPPFQICPRRRRIAVTERLDFEGNVLVPLDPDDVRRAARRLRALGCDSVAVCFLFSFVNPAHELLAGEIVRAEIPDAYLCLSHDVFPGAPEFERTSTTVVNAYVGPRVVRYVNELEARLRALGFGGELLLMQSGGGIMTAAYAMRRPILTLGSGPAAGVMGACAASRQTRFISVDMGGTSYDVCLVNEGRPHVASQWHWVHRYVVAVPMVEVLSIGAGGGSVASVRAGQLQVGPESAGADPGPICYGRGGADVTVTDANLLLGYLNPDGFFGGRMRLDAGGLEEAVEAQIARPLGLSTVEAAYGVHRLANANMNDAIRRVSAERGHDPREFTLVVYGGNGAVHAPAQALDLELPRVVVMKAASTFSALGLLLADYSVEHANSFVSEISRIDIGAFNAVLTALRAKARDELLVAKVHPSDVVLSSFAACRYPGQTFSLDVPLDVTPASATKADIDALIERFHDVHEQMHTYAQRDQDVILTDVRVRAVAPGRRVELAPAQAAAGTSMRGTRMAYFGDGFVDTPVHDGTFVGSGVRIEGPAIVEERFTTIVIQPGQRAGVDELGNYVITC